MAKCGIKHGFGDQTCIRDVGHEGLCRSRAERQPHYGGITYSEWFSKDGKFDGHAGYHTIFPKNMAKETA